MSTRKFAAPDPRIVYSMANQPLTWWKALAEWIDNALDAGAHTVSIEFARDAIIIRDDGRGAVDPVAMIVPGRHTKQAGTVQGLFGVGGKDAALWVGGIGSTTTIVTTHLGVRRGVEVNWSDYIKDSSYDCYDDERGGASGTEIIVAPIARKPPHGKDWDTMVDQLGYVYTPPLGRGVQIKMKRSGKGAAWEPLVPWKAPALQGEIIDVDISVSDKLRAHVYCGVVQDGVLNPRSGFTYFHGNRVVEAKSANGCGGYSPHRIHGRVDLLGQWPRTKNKDALNGDAPTVSDLYTEVARVCQTVLMRGDSVGAELASAEFMATVNERLERIVSGNLKQRKAKRSQPSGVIGTVMPTGTGSPHARAQREQAGTRFPSRKVPTVRIVYDAIEGARVGRVQLPTITLNTANPLVDRARADNNVDATVVAALSLLTAEQCYAPNGQAPLPGFEREASTDNFSGVLGNLLAKGTSIDGSPLSERKGSIA